MPAAVRLRQRVLEQRGLADPGLADEQQRPAPAVAGVEEQALKARALSCPADQHRAGV